ncbi:MAG: nucleotidyl transferase AbiEii/AbiGii toxin family protein [Spirochaetaceae bacterium]
MTHKELLTRLVEEGIEFVVIGGTALRLYNSPRVTHDIDLAIRELDVDRVVALMYRLWYRLVTAVYDDSLSTCPTNREADEWIERQKPGSISFIICSKDESAQVPFERIDVSSQVDFLFELGIPAVQLGRNARPVEIPGLSFLVASIDDLIRLKEARPDRDAADEDDLRFLRGLKADASDSER